MKTLSNLNTKSWYRFLKVLYVLVIVATLLIIYNTYRPEYDSFIKDIVEPVFWVLLVLEIFKRSFYFIFLGTLSPIKVEIDTYVLQIKKAISDFKGDADAENENVKHFLNDVYDLVQNEIEVIDKKDGDKDYDKILKINNLVNEAHKLYRIGRKDYPASNEIKIKALYHAQELGVNINWVDIYL